MRQHKVHSTNAGNARADEIYEWFREFQEVESNHSGRLSYVPSQPAAIPSSRSMLSRDKRLTLDTWNTSRLQENVFWSSRTLSKNSPFYDELVLVPGSRRCCLDRPGKSWGQLFFPSSLSALSVIFYHCREVVANSPPGLDSIPRRGLMVVTRNTIRHSCIAAHSRPCKATSQHFRHACLHRVPRHCTCVFY